MLTPGDTRLHGTPAPAEVSGGATGGETAGGIREFGSGLANLSVAVGFVPGFGGATTGPGSSGFRSMPGAGRSGRVGFESVGGPITGAMTGGATSGLAESALGAETGVTGGRTMSVAPDIGIGGRTGPAFFLSPNVVGADCAATWTIVKPKTPTRPRASVAIWIRRTGIPPLVVETAGQRGRIFPPEAPANCPAGAPPHSPRRPGLPTHLSSVSSDQ